jgi:acetyltransferase-like isoleucine patch superfamily enzyme
MKSLRRTIATSEHPLARTARYLRQGVRGFGVPAPRLLVLPAVASFLAVRWLYYFLKRVLICEPFLKAHCTRYGKRLRADVYLHWIQGQGDLIVGDDVTLGGKCAITFAARFCDRPLLQIGNQTDISHGCVFWIGKQITIGDHCMIGGDVAIRDSNGHPADPEARRAGLLIDADDVRPVTIEDNVWIGIRSIISPGVTIGEGSIVAAGSVVMSDVPPYTVVAGNPARKIGTLEKKSAASAPERPAVAALGPS